ncbi:non-ribosomal peptide synthetase [Millisia brevis]|uniref:non-ribosomal peptide synthetase n=1 Tax=Millisia brevis TaxID=264148 RepID=UPI00082AD67A|nr:non-ribosomal peptide synthetase [Millisia brevis]
MSDDERAALLRALVAEAGLGSQASAGVEAITAAAPESGERPLSAAQQRMWFMQRAAPGSATYNLSGSVDLTGRCRPDIVVAAVEAIVDRHEVLRTTYRQRSTGTDDTSAEPGDRSIEVVGVPLTAPADLCAVVDASAWSAEELGAAIAGRARQPFDLSCAAPIRCTLFVLSPTRHRLLIVAHHVAVDFVSFDILLAELSMHYRRLAAARDGRADVGEIDPLPLQYADYARWERTAGDRSAAQIEYWVQALNPPPPALDLPLSRPRPPVLGSAGGRRELALSAEVADRLRARARASGATTWMALVAAVNVLMYRYSSETDIAVGAPVSTRDLPELQPLIGNFVNTVVLRTDLSGEPDFGEVVRRTVRACNAAFAHQDVPFDRVVEAVGPPRSAGRTPFFDVMCSYRSGVPQAIDAGECVISAPDPVQETARFDLVLEFTDAPDVLSVAAIYRTDLFDVDSVDRILGHLALLIEDAVDRFDSVPIGVLEILGDRERDLVVRQWSRGADIPIDGTPVHRMVERIAHDHPDRIAITSSAGRMTYGEVVAAAQDVAGRLIAAGVGPETTIGIAVPRGPEQVCAVLGALRSGGSFVPLDLDWPPERQHAVLERAGIRIVIAAGSDYDAGTDEVVIVAASEPDEPAETPPPVDVSDDAMAYVVFTSGSTGEPKGAIITHGAIGFRLRWHADLLGLGASDAVLYKAPLSFDISINEMLLPLTCGARLVIADAGRDGDPGYLLDVIERERVTFFYVVASVLDVMVDHPRFSTAVANLTHVWCGGEALTAALHDRFRAACRATMYNGYGPAETTIGVSHRVFRDGDDDPRITIGRPNENSQLYLLDADQQPVPIGVVGEIYIGGAQLARGYINAPYETADRFVPDPFSGAPGARLYRSGDLARFCSGGEIQFVGRTDSQVKVRGFRIELGEIEAHLRQHPDIRQVAVMVAAGPAGGTELVAFVAPVAETSVSGIDLKAWLLRKVPEYMVPAAIEVLPQLPLTRAGKTDRKALAGTRRVPVSVAAQRPRNDWEQLVSDSWCAVLGIDAVGVHTNFFEAGGHSLLLAAMQPMLFRRTGVEVSIVDLYAYPTVAGLAEWFAAKDGTGNSSSDHRNVHRDRARRQRDVLRARLARRDLEGQGRDGNR